MEVNVKGVGVDRGLGEAGEGIAMMVDIGEREPALHHDLKSLCRQK